MKRIDESVVPLRSESIDWSADGNGFVTITMENSGFFNKALQLLMNKPKRSFIHLDEKGSFFWLKADGSHTLEEIAVGSVKCRRSALRRLKDFLKFSAAANL